jgi:hypothetical protein
MSKIFKSKKTLEQKKSSAQVKPDEKQSDDLQLKLKTASDGLFYISETEAPFDTFVWNRKEKNGNQPTADEVLKMIGRESDAKVTEKNLAEFFAQPTQMQDWFGDEEKTQVEKFANLKELLAKNLREIRVFKIGEVQIDIYIVGVDRDGNLAGVKTKAVET